MAEGNYAEALKATKSDDGHYRVFVYGTLRTDHGNNRAFLSLAKRIGRMKLVGDYSLRDLGGFPAVVITDDAEQKTPVWGEVWEVDGGEFRALDRLEGYPNFYARKVVPTPWGYAWMYYLPHGKWLSSGNPKVDSGLWRPFAGETKIYDAVPTVTEK